MSQRRQYGFERRRKEGARRAKQEAKRARKTGRAEEGVTGPEMGEAPETAAPSGLWEWFSPSRGRTVTSTPGTRPPDEAPDDWVLLTDVSEEPGDQG
jgi:hypothetical protein